MSGVGAPATTAVHDDAGDGPPLASTPVHVRVVAACLLLLGCHVPRSATVHYWVEKGDAALATDPGRAAANYERGVRCEDWQTEPALFERIDTATASWLKQELRARDLAGVPCEEQLGWLGSIRSMAGSAAGQLEAELAPREAAAWRACAAEKSKQLLAKTPGWDAPRVFEAVADAMPEGSDVRREVLAEAQRRREALVKQLEANHPNPALRARLVEAAKRAPASIESPTWPKDGAMASSVRWTVTVSGCPGIAAERLTPVTQGARSGTVKVTATCEAAPRLDTETKEERVTHKPRTRTRYEKRCRQVDSGGQATCTYRDSNGNCASSSGGVREVCTIEPVTETIEQEPGVKRSTVQVARVRAHATGTIAVDADGRSWTLPFEVSNTVDGTSTADALESLSGALFLKVLDAIRPDEQAQRQRFLAVADERLRAGDLAAAEEALVTALALGASALPPSFEAVAARDGLSLLHWGTLITSGVSASSRLPRVEITPASGRGPMRPAPDPAED